jgi:hypothetical protein
MTKHPAPWRVKYDNVMDANGKRIARCETVADARLIVDIAEWLAMAVVLVVARWPLGNVIASRLGDEWVVRYGAAYLTKHGWGWSAAEATKWPTLEAAIAAAKKIEGISEG